MFTNLFPISEDLAVISVPFPRRLSRKKRFKFLCRLVKLKVGRRRLAAWVKILSNRLDGTAGRTSAEFVFPLRDCRRYSACRVTALDQEHSTCDCRPSDRYVLRYYAWL